MALPKIRNRKPGEKDKFSKDNRELFETLPTSVKRRAIEADSQKSKDLPTISMPDPQLINQLVNSGGHA